RSTSRPPPEPRSRTSSPGASSARAVGLPHPREAASAVSDGASVPSYRPMVMGSVACGPQHDALLPDSSESRAAEAYRSWTMAWVSCCWVTRASCFDEHRIKGSATRLTLVLKYVKIDA